MIRYQKAFISICASVLILGSLALGYAAAQVATGDITGRVLDPSGAVVPGATVTARNTGTGLTRAVATRTGLSPATSGSGFMQAVSLFGPGFGPPVGRPRTLQLGARFDF